MDGHADMFHGRNFKEVAHDRYKKSNHAQKHCDDISKVYQ